MERGYEGNIKKMIKICQIVYPYQSSKNINFMITFIIEGKLKKWVLKNCTKSKIETNKNNSICYLVWKKLVIVKFVRRRRDSRLNEGYTAFQKISDARCSSGSGGR